MTPIRTAANKAGKEIPVGDSPDALAVTENGKTVYVVNFANGPGTARGTDGCIYSNSRRRRRAVLRMGFRW